MKQLAALFVLFITFVLGAQNKSVYQSVKEITNETQRLVSVKKGEQIDTASFRKLFLPTAHFTVVGAEDGEQIYETMTLNEFIESLTDEYYSKGYFETNKGQIIEEYNGIAQVIESFYGEDSDGVKGFGVNSYQLIYSNKRWWIANMIWTMSNHKGEDIPKKYYKN
tara:strand:+ start:54400 stop:54897 length:498 start_codon:yes stop_codon:yes gene_type:complete